MSKKRNYFNLYFLTFFITLALFFIPFGIQWLINYEECQNLITSLFSQGFSYHDSFKELLLSEQLTTLFTQGQINLGENFESMFIQYFGNFTNLFSLLVEQKHLPLFFFLLTGTKVSLASITFLYFLRFFELKKTPLQITFSVLYGLSGYGLLYLINPLWLDSLVLLPLLILGVHRYVYVHTKKLFITTFLIAVLNNPTNLSVLWVTCSLYFLLQTCLIQSSKLKTETLNYLKLFIWTFGFSAFILLPLVLTNPSFLIGISHSTEWLSFNWLSTLLLGSNETNLFPTLTQSFLTLGTLMGCFLFFSQNHRSKTEKSYYAFFLIVLIGLSSFQPLSTSHLTTNHLITFNPYLLSVIFFMFWFSYRAFYHLNETSTQKQTTKVTSWFALGLTIILLAVNIQLSVFKLANSLLGITINIILCLSYLFVFNSQKRITLSLIILLLTEILSSQIIRLEQGTNWLKENKVYYQNTQHSETSVITTSLESWFRQEKKLTHFTSSPITTLLTSASSENLRSSLSTYFIANPFTNHLNPSNQYFENQNLYIKTLFNLSNHPKDKIFVPIDYEIYSSQNLSIYSDNEIIELLNSEEAGTLHLRLYPKENKELYLYLGQTASFISVQINNNPILSKDLIHYTIPEDSDVVDLIFTFNLNNNDKTVSLPKFQVLNSNLFETLATYLEESPFHSLTFEPNQIEGTFTTKESRYLLINIPYHPNWHAYTDSKEVPIYQLENECMIIPIEEEAENFTLSYHPRYLQIGMGISLITLTYHLIHKTNKRKEGYYERKDS